MRPRRYVEDDADETDDVGIRDDDQTLRDLNREGANRASKKSRVSSDSADQADDVGSKAGTDGKGNGRGSVDAVVATGDTDMRQIPEPTDKTDMRTTDNDKGPGGDVEAKGVNRPGATVTAGTASGGTLGAAE